MSPINERNREDWGYFCCVSHSRKHACDQNKICFNFLLYNYVIKHILIVKNIDVENTSIPSSMLTPPIPFPRCPPFLVWCVSV